MDRLTTDNPQNNMESAYNLFSIKNKTTVCGLTEDNHEITLYDLMRHCSEVLHCCIAYDDGTDNSIGDFLYDQLFDGLDSPEGILAHFYTTAWAFSVLREKLKAYEDTGLTPEEIITLKEHDTLKKALELAVNKIGTCTDCNQNCNYCVLHNPDYFIQQMQRQKGGDTP